MQERLDLDEHRLPAFVFGRAEASQTHTRQLFESWLKGVGGKLSQTIEVHGSEAAKILVEAGIGYSFMSVHGLHREIRENRFKRLPVAGLQLRRPIYLVQHIDKRTSPVMQAFKNLLQIP